ncbi:MAG: hypothetical protein AAFR82_12030 [Pseudomonadota bacterium]
MSDPSLSPSSNDDDPIDAEFEPAQRTESSGLLARSGPGWLAYLVLATICLGVSVYGAGLIPGFKPGSSDLAALQSEITTIQAAEDTQTTQAAALETDIAALKSRADNLQADRTRAVTDIRGLREEIEALRADISSLQRARIASIAEPSEEDAETPERPDLSAITTRLTSVEDALISQLTDYDNALGLLKTRVEALEAKAAEEALTSGTSANARTEAALALSAIEAAARRGRPFLSAHQRLAAAMPGNQAIGRLAPLATDPIPTLSDLSGTLPELTDRALDQDARSAGTGNSWMRQVFGDGIQVRRDGELTTTDHLRGAETALAAGDLGTAIEQIRALDADLQPVFTDWLNNADNRLMLEQTLEALRLTMIAEERP